MSARLNWRFLLGEFFVVVLGVLVALWVDGIQTARVEADLEIEYLKSFLVDLDGDMAQYDSFDVWSRRQEASAATVLSLYEGRSTNANIDDLVAAVETAGWQYVPVIYRNTIDDLRSTGNLRLIRDPGLRRAIASYYTVVEVGGVPIANMRERMWNQYDARVSEVLRPGQRLRVLQQMPGSFGTGVTSDAVEAAEAPDLAELVGALRAVPELEVAAREVLYQSVNNRAGVALMRDAALELRGILEQRLGPAGER